jgi:hypothetical protein
MDQERAKYGGARGRVEFFHVAGGKITPFLFALNLFPD